MPDYPRLVLGLATLLLGVSLLAISRLIKDERRRQRAARLLGVAAVVTMALSFVI